MSGKGTRTYRSDLRRRQAEATRSRVVAAAAELFAADGYPRTTLARIAAAAGVSAETVQGHGPKAALLIAAVQHAAFGVSGEDVLFSLPVGRELLALDHPDAVLDRLAAWQADLHERTAPMAPALLGGASADPELDRYLTDMYANTVRQIRRTLERFRDRGWLRDDVPFEELVETTVVLSSTETYAQVTRRDGWGGTAYRAWYRRLLAETVFRPPT
jgi:AcrR family transcriptional regulator